MKKMRTSLLAGVMVVASLVAVSPGAFAAALPQSVIAGNTLNLPSSASKTTSIDVVFTNIQQYQLSAPSTANFTFTPVDSQLNTVNSPAPMTEQGTLIDTNPVTYSVPLPNFGHQETVQVAGSITVGSGANLQKYQSLYAPLVDTLPEAPIAAALPLSMLAIWYIQRKRKVNLPA